MEAAIFDSVINNNYGMLKRVFDLDERVSMVESWQDKHDLLDNVSEKESVQSHSKWGVLGQWVAAAAATISIYFSLKK
jgi:hypothetical protein